MRNKKIELIIVLINFLVFFYFCGYFEYLLYKNPLMSEIDVVENNPIVEDGMLYSLISLAISVIYFSSTNYRN